MRIQMRMKPGMKPARKAAPRKAVNLSVRQDLVREARKRGVNLSRLLEEAIDRRLRLDAGRRWQDENREAIRAYNERIARDGPWNKDLLSF